MSSCGSYSYSYSYGHCAPSSHASAQCQTAYNSYESNRDSLSCSYTQTHDTSCHTPPVSVSVLSLAMQEAAQLGAGVQGTVGCTIDPTPTQIAGWQALTPTLTDGTYNLGAVSGTTAVLGGGDGDTLNIDTGDNNTLVVGDGAGDQINLAVIGDGNTLFAGNGDYDSLMLTMGDNNILWAGNGTGDTAEIIQGNNNDLHLGNGDGSIAYVFDGDNNCLTVGDGYNSGAGVGNGSSNELTAGNGDLAILSVDSGDNNLLTVGNGAGDQLSIGSGPTGFAEHNTLIAGNGDGDILTVGSGNYSLLHAGDGSTDQLTVYDGDFNVLIAGNGDHDTVTVLFGDNNVLAVGDGAHDTLSLGGGSSNIILDGNGANDVILVDGATFDGVNGHVGTASGDGNVIVMGNGADDQAWGGLGDNNSYLTGSGNDLVHTGGGSDFVYVDNHTETATPSDPYHLTSTDSLAQNLYADGGSDTFAIQGAIINTSHHCGSYSFGNCYSNAVTFHCGTASYGGDSSGNVTPLGTTVMTGGGGVEKYWVDGAFGNAVVTDFNSANGDRVMVGGVWDGTNSTLSSLGTVHTEYIHSAYDTANTGNVDLLITFGSGATQGSITLIDFLPQDTGGAGGTTQFDNVTFTNAAAAESTLAHIFDFSQTDNQAVTDHVASLAASNLILH